MHDLWSIDGFTLLLIGVALFSILEIFFLFARVIESETSLHDLRVRSHTLRRQMIEQAAQELIDQRKATERTIARSGSRSASPAPTPMAQPTKADDEPIVIREDDPQAAAVPALAA